MSSPRPILVIGSKRFSSWSMRAWVALTAGEIDFSEIEIPLYTDSTAATISDHSPSGKVPALKLGETVITDSLAIGEWAAEQVPSLLPTAPLLRALARSAAAEMHAGFPSLRQECPMDLGIRLDDRSFSPACLGDLARLEALWADCRRRAERDGPYLFGGFTLADASFAPVAMRILSYGLPVHGASRAYVDALAAHPAVSAWVAGATAPKG